MSLPTPVERAIATILHDFDDDGQGGAFSFAAYEEEATLLITALTAAGFAILADGQAYRDGQVWTLKPDGWSRNDVPLFRLTPVVEP